MNDEIIVGIQKFTPIDDRIDLYESYDIDSNTALVLYEKRSSDYICLGTLNIKENIILNEIELLDVYDHDAEDFKILKRVNQRYYAYVGYDNDDTDNWDTLVYEIAEDFKSVHLIDHVIYKHPSEPGHNFRVAGTDKYLDNILYDNDNDYSQFVRFEIDSHRVYEVDYLSNNPDGNPHRLKNGASCRPDFMSLVESDAFLAINNEHIYLYKLSDLSYMHRYEWHDIFEELTESAVDDVYAYHKIQVYNDRNKGVFKIESYKNITGESSVSFAAIVVSNYEIQKLQFVKEEAIDEIINKHDSHILVKDTMISNAPFISIEAQYNDYVLFKIRYLYRTTDWSERLGYDVFYAYNIFDGEFIFISNGIDEFIKIYNYNTEDKSYTSIYAYYEDAIFTYSNIFAVYQSSITSPTLNFLDRYLSTINFYANESSRYRKENIINNVRAGWDINNPIEFGQKNNIGQKPDISYFGIVTKTETVKKENVYKFVI